VAEAGEGVGIDPEAPQIRRVWAHPVLDGRRDPGGGEKPLEHTPQLGKNSHLHIPFFARQLPGIR
jgi:hypothetical protein